MQIPETNLNIINADCMDVMKDYTDQYFDLAIVDPPYGLSINSSKKSFVNTKHKLKKWDSKVCSNQYFEILSKISKRQIIWGGNYFSLPPKKGWICWDKENPMKGKFSDFELAWTSFLNCDYIYKQAWIGYGRKFKEKSPSIHPTQKPILLYQWLLQEFSKPEWKVIDTHLGSGSNAIANHYFGTAEFVGIELDKDYYNASVERIINETLQLTFDF